MSGVLFGFIGFLSVSGCFNLLQPASEGFKVFQDDGVTDLLVLIDKAKQAKPATLSEKVFKSFDQIIEARSLRPPIAWSAIAQSLDIDARDVPLLRATFSREKRRHAIKTGNPIRKEVMPAGKPVLKPEPVQKTEKKGVNLIDRMATKDGACEIFKSFPSID